MTKVEKKVVKKDRKQFVVGTAGHIDHGKTALIKALTGVETDRLPEEKTRGITIELGFAKLELGDLQISLVDVPGHEKFIKTMVSGASGLDAILLLIAADDGVMPQTREHLAIAEFLGIQKGIVVLSKCDAVDQELLELVEEDITDFVQGTFLENAAIIKTSALQNIGIDVLKKQLYVMLEGQQSVDLYKTAYLPIDRYFLLKGHGLVVTGTLQHGSLKVDDKIEVHSSEKHSSSHTGTIRSLQVHGQSMQQIEAGTRVAVQLKGIEHQELQGQLTLFPQKSLHPSSALHISFKRLADSPIIQENDELTLHVGSQHVLCRAVPLESNIIDDQNIHMLRLVLHKNVVVFTGQGCILRQPGLNTTLETIGGGKIIDPHPPFYKGAYKNWGRMARALYQFPHTTGLLEIIKAETWKGISQAKLKARLAESDKNELQISTYLKEHTICVREEKGEQYLIHNQHLQVLKKHLLQNLENFHREHPIRDAATQGELQKNIKEIMHPWIHSALSLLQQESLIIAKNNTYKLATFNRSSSAHTTISNLLKIIKAAGLQAHNKKQLLEASNLEENDFNDALGELKSLEDVAELSEALIFANNELVQLKDILLKFFTEHKELKMADFKELSGGVSRKYAIPLLEWCDQQKITRRVGDCRTLF